MLTIQEKIKQIESIMMSYSVEEKISERDALNAIDKILKSNQKKGESK